MGCRFKYGINEKTVNVLRYENEYALVSEGIEKGGRLLLSRLSSLINGQKVTYSIY